MSKPSNDILSEIMAIRSSLNMEPEVIPGCEDELFISDRFVWAKHAIEHLDQLHDLVMPLLGWKETKPGHWTQP
jgi:hypothetical protein